MCCIDVVDGIIGVWIGWIKNGFGVGSCLVYGEIVGYLFGDVY